VTLRIDITGLAPERLAFVPSPLAELTAMLHVLAAPEHHPRHAQWAADMRAGLAPDLTERLSEAEFLWRSSRAQFMVPAQPRASLAAELDDVDRIDDEKYITSALVTTCGSNRRYFVGPSLLADAATRDRALDQVQARGALQEDFARRLVADPAATRARVRETLEQCGEAFFDAAWTSLAAQLCADARMKKDLVERHGLGAALASASTALALAPDGDCIVLDKLQDNATSASNAGVTFIPTTFGHPHVVTVHAPGWQPVVQYPTAESGVADEPNPLQIMELRLEALAHPVRMRLVRTLARSPQTTGELAGAWSLTPPEVSRHLAVLRRAGLLTAQRQGRYVRHAVDLHALSRLGADLVSAIMR
jgi:DNA-binding transcriptional ArsR family regulator